jgi:5-methyltetrahydrofolate--homocysteine methyltransferase
MFDFSKGVVFYDGAMGTMLQNKGLKPGEKPDFLNMSNPSAVESVHRQYIEAGSNIICTNTFGANADALRGTDYTPEDIIRAAVRIAKLAAANKAKVALSIGPTGQLLDPLGDLMPKHAYDMFRQQAISGQDAGADFVAIETMSDLDELKLALRAVKENTALSVLATMTFNSSGYTFTGCTPDKFAAAAEELGAAAIGLNCSLGPSEMYGTAEKLLKATTLPVIIKPNAGLPDSTTGLYNLSPSEFAEQMLPFKDMGAKILGGCCGTSPEYISELIRAVKLSI